MPVPVGLKLVASGDSSATSGEAPPQAPPGGASLAEARGISGSDLCEDHNVQLHGLEFKLAPKFELQVTASAPPGRFSKKTLPVAVRRPSAPRPPPCWRAPGAAFQGRPEPTCAPCPHTILIIRVQMLSELPRKLEGVYKQRRCDKADNDKRLRAPQWQSALWVPPAYPTGGTFFFQSPNCDGPDGH